LAALYLLDQAAITANRDGTNIASGPTADVMTPMAANCRNCSA